MQYYLVSTNHLEDKDWFRDDEDFKAGMNAVGLYACLLGIQILAFILMSNHVHFVLYCSQIDAALFINEFKRHYSRYIQRKYGIKELLRRNEVDIREIENENESLERAIAYVQMNSVAANICIHPTAYLWGSGNCFFSGNRVKGTRINSLPKARRYRIMHSKLPVADSLIMGEEGYILPESYVSVSTVEALFRNPKRMNFFLNTSSKARKKVETGESAAPAFRDQTIIPAFRELIHSLYQKHTFEELNADEQVEVLKQLRYRFSCNTNQLSRVCGLTYEKTARLLDKL